MKRWKIHGRDSRDEDAQVVMLVDATLRGEAEDLAAAQGVQDQRVQELRPGVVEVGYLTALEGIAAVLCVVVGAALLAACFAGGSAPAAGVDRFLSSNAMGASANSLERMEARQQALESAIDRAGRGVMGAVFLAIAAAISHRGVVRRVHDRMPPVIISRTKPVIPRPGGFEVVNPHASSKPPRVPANAPAVPKPPAGVNRDSRSASAAPRSSNPS